LNIIISVKFYSIFSSLLGIKTLQNHFMFFFFLLFPFLAKFHHFKKSWLLNFFRVYLLEPCTKLWPCFYNIFNFSQKNPCIRDNIFSTKLEQCKILHQTIPFICLLPNLPFSFNWVNSIYFFFILFFPLQQVGKKNHPSNFFFLSKYVNGFFCSIFPPNSLS